MSDKFFKPSAYGYKIKGKHRRLNCQSGGAFTAIAEKLIDIGYIIYGVEYIHPQALYRRITSKTDLKKLSGSKYIQADLSCLNDIESDLKFGNSVLFCGPPCYCMALLSFCKCKNINIEKLLTIEFLCHGVPSPELFKFFIEHTEKDLGIKIKDYIFRDKHINGWGGLFSTICIRKGLSFTSESWMNIFQTDKYLRPSCYQCRFASHNRISDIVISDFWNIGNSSHGKFFDPLGVSMIIFNTEKSIHYKKYFSSNGTLIKVKLSEIEQAPLNHPAIYKCDSYDIDCEDISFTANAEKIINYYKKPWIKLFCGLPITSDINFIKEFYTFRFKRSPLFVIFRKVFKFFKL